MKRFRTIKPDQITEEQKEAARKKFRELENMKEVLHEREEKYRKLVNKPIEERMVYRSSSDIELDVRIPGNSSRAPQERQTMQLRDDEIALIALKVNIGQTEEALNVALDAAVEEAPLNNRAKYRSILKAHLMDGIPASDCQVSYRTLKKYVDYALTHAAMNLEYIEKLNRGTLGNTLPPKGMEKTIYK